jgi:hypothetical protein|uniref:Uncharacterized protein n=1 Tax=Mus musculus TaxID=10090 RepID=Q3UWE0_MOUSE|nr:unnamed protein product [Mus musculus]
MIQESGDHVSSPRLRRSWDICLHFGRKGGSRTPTNTRKALRHRCLAHWKLSSSLPVWKITKRKQEEARFLVFLFLLKSHHIPSSLGYNSRHGSIASFEQSYYLYSDYECQHLPMGFSLKSHMVFLYFGLTNSCNNRTDQKYLRV